MASETLGDHRRWRSEKTGEHGHDTINSTKLMTGMPGPQSGTLFARQVRKIWAPNPHCDPPCLGFDISNPSLSEDFLSLPDPR